MTTALDDPANPVIFVGRPELEAVRDVVRRLEILSDFSFSTKAGEFMLVTATFAVTADDAVRLATALRPRVAHDEHGAD